MADWTDFFIESSEDSDDSLQTVCGWRNGNSIGKASVSVGKRSTRRRTFDKNNFCLKQNELAEVQYRDSVYDDIPTTARNQLPNKTLSHLSKPSDCLNVSDSDMSLSITHGYSMRTNRTVPHHIASSYNMSSSHQLKQQTSSSSPCIGHRVPKKSGFETPRGGNTLARYNTFRNVNGSKDVSNAITENDVSSLIEAAKCLSPGKIQLLRKVLDSTSEGSPMFIKRYPKMMSTSKRRTNKLYQAKRKYFNAKSDSSDLSSAVTDCSDNTINTMRPLHTNNNEMYSTRMTEFKLPSIGLHRKIIESTKPLSSYDLRNDAMSNVTAESHIRGVSPAHSNYLSSNYTGQPLKKKLFIISDSDQLTDEVASDCNTEVKSSKDRLMEPYPQQQEDNGSPTLNFAHKKNTKKPEVIKPCYVHIRKEDIITNTGSLTKTSLSSEKGIQYNKFQSSLLSSPSDGEPAKDSAGTYGFDVNNGIYIYNMKPRSGSRYGRLHERNKFLYEDDGVCTVVRLKEHHANTMRTRRRKMRFHHF